jgi:hypothetical protein
MSFITKLVKCLANSYHLVVKKVHSAHNEKVNSGISADSYDIESQVLGCNLLSFKSWYRESTTHELGLGPSPRHSV